MIKKERTVEVYGYSTDEVSKGSNKKIIVECDYCHKEYSVINKIRNKSNSVVNKDSCKDCRYKKMADVNMANYGVSNQFARKEIKEKIKNDNIEKYGVESYTQTQEFMEKAKNTNIEKYGHDHAMKSEEIRNRQKESILNKYGVENVSQLQDIKDKVKKTCIDKYGTEYALSSKVVRDKIKKTNIEKYGVENPFQSDEIKNKIIETNINNLGVAYPMQSDVVRNKSESTVLNKYGVKNVAQSKEIKDKIISTNLKRYGFKNPMSNVNVKYKVRSTLIKNGVIKTYNGKTMSELSKENSKAYSTFTYHVRTFGIDYALSVQKRETGIEAKVRVLLEKNNINYKQNATINKRRTDFLLEEHNVILECDGLFWHSDCVAEDNYHAIKRQDYTDVGYRSLFFREDEISNKIDIIESIILNACNKTKNKIFARKCEIKIVDKKEAAAFFNKNHLMGAGKGGVYGLYYDNNLFSAIQIKRIKNNDYEISRFCNILNTSIIGGFSKLIKYAENILSPDSITTFIDLRYGEGKYLESLGFNHICTNLSFRWVGDSVTFHRMKFKGSSGYDAGLAKIWDCGQAKFIKQLK